MTITELLQPLRTGRHPKHGARAPRLGLFTAQRSRIHSAIRPGVTVAGPVLRAGDTPDWVICRPHAELSREYLVPRAQKRLMDRVVDLPREPADSLPRG